MSWKPTIMAFSGAFCLAFLQCAYPHLFTYRLCEFLCLGFFSISMADMALSPFPAGNPSLFSRYLRVLADAFPVLLLLGITTFFVGALNEKLYAQNAEAHSINGGFFTLGGVIPRSDSYVYVAAIQSFLHEGIMTGMALFRPFPHLFATVLYRLSGSDLAAYFHLTTGLLIVCVWFHGMVVARYAGRFISIFSSCILCWYFARFQATFMTELAGGSLGMVAIALLLLGYFERSLKAYAVGVLLMAVAMQMRTGVVLLLPALVVGGGFRFRERFRKPYMAYLVVGILMVGSLSLPDLQNRLFRKPMTRQSNAATYLVQVMRNADTWNVIWSEYPFRKNEGLVEQMQRASIGIKAELMRRPDVFVRNYISMMIRYSPRVQRFLMPWSGKISSYWGWLVLLSFLSACWRLPLGSAERTLSRLLLPYILCCFLGLPMLYEICIRFYAASISLNMLITAIAAYNILDLTRTAVRGLRVRGSILTGSKTPIAETPLVSLNVARSPSVFFLPVLLILMAVLGPIVIDRYRIVEPSADPIPISWPEKPGTTLRHVDIRKSLYVLLDPVNDFKVEDPLVMPRSKWVRDWMGRTPPSQKSYWVLPKYVRHLNESIPQTNEPVLSLVLPQTMLGGLRMSEIESLIIRVNDKKIPMPPVLNPGSHEVSEVLEVRLKPKTD